MQKRRFTNKLFAGLLSALTALSPALSVVPVYATTDDDMDGIDVQTDVDGSGIEVTNTSDTNKISIEVNGVAGELVIDEGKETEQTVRISESEDGKKASVTDANGQVTEAEVNSENPYAVVLERGAGSVASVEAKADNGFEVSQYSILMDSGAEEKTEFKTDSYSAFTYDLTFDADKTVTVGFAAAPEGVDLTSNTDGISISTETPEGDTQIEVEGEVEPETEGDGIEIDAETETPAETEDDQIVIESETPADTFVSVYLGDEVPVDELNASDFASMRLVVLTDGEFDLVNEGDVIGHYGDYYLLEFTSIQQTMNAYVYYKDKVLAVEPDKTVESATDNADSDDDVVIINDTPIAMDEDVNPLNMLGDAQGSADVSTNGNVIALIDTGASESDNVIGHVSMIDDVMTGEHEHADKMVGAIVSQNGDAKILSIRAMGDNGFGTVSSLVAAMEYAIEQKVDVINLSLYVRASLSTSVLTHEIDKATEAGITVVGAAGNDGVSVADYVPGSVESAIVIGACDESGKRINSSNFGQTVDYNVVADSTSVATALFTGFISANGVSGVDAVLNQGLIFATDFEGNDDDIVVQPGEDEQPEIPSYADFEKYVPMTDRSLLVKYTFASAAKLEAGDTIDSVVGDDEAVVDKLVTNDMAFSQLYDAGDGTYKFKIDAPFVNGLTDTAYVDFTFARQNFDGEVITDGVSFDKETGIGSIDADVFREMENGALGDVQFQVLIAGPDIMPDNIPQTLTLVDADGNVLSEKKNFDNIGTMDMNVLLDIEGISEGLTVNDFDVYLNGETVSQYIFYDDVSHQLTVRNCRSALVYDMRIVVRKAVEHSVQIANNPFANPVIFWLGEDQYDAANSLKQGHHSVVCRDTYSEHNLSSLSHGQTVYPGSSSQYGTLSWVYFPLIWGGVNWTPHEEDGSLKNDGTAGTSYVNAIDGWCVHLGFGAKGPSDSRPFGVEVSKQEVDGVLYIQVDFQASECIAGGSSDGDQRSSGRFTVAVKQGKPDLKIQKRPDSSCKLIYKNGKKADGLLNPYKDLTTKFAIYNWDTKKKTLGKKIGSNFETDSDGNITLKPSDNRLKALKLNTTYALVEVKAPKNYKNEHSASAIKKDSKACVTFKWEKTEDNKPITVTVKDKALGDPTSILLFKNPISVPKGAVDPAMGFDFSDAEYELKYYQPKANDNGYVSDPTYTYRLKLTDICGDGTMWELEVGNPASYLSDRSSFSHLLVEDSRVDGGYRVTYPLGKIVISEIKVPAGCEKHHDVVVYVDDNKGQGKFRFETPTDEFIDVTITDAKWIAANEPLPWIGLHLDKTVMGGKELIDCTTLEGVTFTIYNGNNSWMRDKNGHEYAPGAPVTTAKMQKDSNGNWYAEVPAILPVNWKYTVRETEGNQYYPVTDNTEVTITVPQKYTDGTGIADGTIINVSNNSLAGKGVTVTTSNGQSAHTFDNKPVRGGVTIQKVDYLTESNQDHANGSLEGAEFTVVPAFNFAVKEDNVTKVPGIFAGKGYTCEQLKNPNPEPSYSDIEAAIPKSKMITITTDKYGNAKSSNKALSWGNYYIIETKAPTSGAYEINREYVGKIEIRNEHAIVKPKNVGQNMGVDSDDVQEAIFAGGLKVQKIDYMRDTNTCHGDTNLSGAEFTIVNASKKSAVNYQHKTIKTSELYKNGNNVTWNQVKAFADNPDYVMDVITTDNAGAAQTHKHNCSKGSAGCEYTRLQKEGLPFGTYYVIETKAPTGYLRNEVWVGKIDVTVDGVVYEPVVIQGADYHRPENHTRPYGVPQGDEYGTRQQIYRSGISVDKIDVEMQDATRQGDGTLEGAEFTIINASECVVRNHQDEDIPSAKSKLSAHPTWKELNNLSKEGYSVQVITTDENGRATTGRQALPYGTYYMFESKASKGYLINEDFIVKIVVREDDKMMELPTNANPDSSDVNAYWNINEPAAETVPEQPRRGDLHFLKVNIDGEYKPYIPFLISAIQLNSDGTETVLESHVMVCDKNGVLDTARNHSNNTNGMDKYLVGNSKISPEGEKYLKEAAEWGIWFQGNRTDYPKDHINDDFGALYEGYYRITELQCEDNKDLEENLVASTQLIEIRNDTVDYYTPMKPYAQYEDWDKVREIYGVTCGNARPFTYHPLVDTEIEMRSDAADVESGTQTVPVRKDVIVSDTVEIMHISADHKYRLETKFVDMTTGKTLKILSTDDENAEVREDGAYVQKEFTPKKQSGTNSTHDKITVTAHIDTTGLEGHTIMAYDYLYEYIDITNNDAVKGDWVHVKRHPQDGETDKRQMLYVPDLHTMAKDGLTGDRVGAKDKNDKVIDVVEYMNLSKSEEYVLTMTLVDTQTGEPLVKNEDGSAKMVMSPITFRRVETPVSGTVTMPEFTLDSSAFENKTATVVETLYRAAEDGSPMGEPLLVHDSLLDEDQTIRWIDVYTSASDKNTKDDVGTDEDVATVYDTVYLHNVIFDDNDHENPYSYKVKGRLVYQKDFTDADGKEHKAGETVETLDGTQDEVVITSDAAGNVTFTYKDGTTAEGQIVKSMYGHNVAKRVDENRVGDNTYIRDMTAMYCDLTVELAFKVNSMKLAGGTTVVFEELYHDSTGAETDLMVADHKDILDKGQTVHYPDVHTNAEDIKTGDDVGVVQKNGKLVDTVDLVNLVPGRDYVVNGVLMNQATKRPLLVDGKEITQSANIHVTEDGQILSGNGERVEVTSYNKELNEVCGTIDLTFEFDARLLAGETVVVFEDLIHNGIKVATHADIHDKSQTVHFPEIHTTARDVYTEDEVGTVAEKAEIIDTVTYKNLVPGRTYTVSGILMNQKTDEPYLDADGNEVRSERTFVAGEEEDGIVANVDSEKNSVSGTVEMRFSFNGTNLEDITTVVFEDLYHNNVRVTTHSDIHDKSQTIHFPKVRTSAIDVNTGDEVGVVGETTIRDTVNLWNLVPGKDYTIKGLIFDKTTGEFLTDADGNRVEAENPFHVNEDGTVDNCCELPCECKGGTCTCPDWAVCISDIDKDHNDSDGHANLVFKIDASELGGHDLVIYEYLYHNGVVVAKHEDVNDLGQTIHFPDIKTSATDIKTNDTTGTVETQAVVKDVVYYENLVVGREYTIKGVLMNQDTGAPIVNEDGTLVTAEATFTATTESSDVNNVTRHDEADNSVTGEYTLMFTVDSTQLKGKTVVAFETLYHNGIKVVVHADIYDKEQSVHYPEIHTTAVDSSTGDHVGSIWGALMNDVRHLFGETDADGNGIADDKQQNIVDTVALYNLVPGYTYVVSGKLYNVDKSHEAGEPVPIEIDGKEVVQAVTITVSEDGKSIESNDGSKTTVTSYDKQKNRVDGTVDLIYALDSSKVQDTKIVVFEDLYHDATYTPEQNPFDVEKEDIIHTHSDIDDEGQSVSEVGVKTTAIDTRTENHVGAVPEEGADSEDAEAYSVIKDEVNMTKLVPEMEYTVKGVLVDIKESDFAAGKVLYLKADGTLTENREEAYEETYTFVAENTDEIHYLNFALKSDKVQGRALTVFEDLYHNGVKITSHPAYEDVDKWDEVSFQNQTVYYPTGKTNATDNTTGVHTSYADAERVITDRVYFENLIVGENYEISGTLHYQSDFTDKDGNSHKAGDPLDGVAAAVKFTASEDMTEVEYVDREGAMAKVDGLVVSKLPNGQIVVSGYVSLEFTVDASKLVGATVVAFEDFSNNGVKIFVHANLNDLPQTVRIPEIHTNAKVGDLDEASVYDENGEFKDVTIVDTVTYKNLWTQAELDAMHEQGLAVQYADGTYRVEKVDIYDINEKATYIMKGILMNKATGEPLVNAKGETYEVLSEPFSPEANDGEIDIEFVVNAGDLVKDGVDSSELEGLTVVAFEQLYQTDNSDDVGEGTIIAVHEDIEDDEQDIRFPKVRTHAADGIDAEKLDLPDFADGQIVSPDDAKAAVDAHENEKTTTAHEVMATDKIEIVDMVYVENLHGGTEYEVTGTLQVVTKFDENGVPVEYEAAKDDDGNVITNTVKFDTTVLSPDYNDSVSGYVPVTFVFSGVNLAGKTTVAFETLTNNGVVVGVHADIKDAPQTVYMPSIHTNATDALSGLNETLAGSKTVILDKVSYENLEEGKTYTLSGTLHKKSDGSVVDGSTVGGTFVAGVENQYIMADGTKVMTLDELRAQLGTTSTQKDWSSAADGNTNANTNSDTDVNAGGDGSLDVSEKTEYVVGKDIPAGYYKITPVDSDGSGLFGYWCIYYSKDGTIPTERTLKTTLTNGIVSNDNTEDYIRLSDNMVLQIANSVINGEANSEFVQVDAAEAEPNLNQVVADYYESLDKPVTDADVSDEVTDGEKPDDEATDAVVDGETDVDESDEDESDVNSDTEPVSKGDMQKRVSGDVYVVFVVNTEGLAGDTVVAFESLSTVDDEGKDKILATHEDIDDEDQSVLLPKIGTSATIDGAKTADASEKSVVVDTVTYENLTPGRTYQMVGTLMDKTTGKSTGVVASKEFTPEKSSGTIEITFTLDTTSYVGRQLVVFEELLSKSEDGNDYIVAEHKDITDAAQTVTVTQPPEDKVTPNVDTSDMLRIGYLFAGLSMLVLLAAMMVLRKRKNQV